MSLPLYHDQEGIKRVTNRADEVMSMIDEIRREVNRRREFIISTAFSYGYNVRIATLLLDGDLSIVWSFCHSYDYEADGISYDYYECPSRDLLKRVSFYG